ncbi:hypothetical protein BYT27DRAFT_7205317 [Phlegmacium glaucopus]|nr:hypothetical protein BYT27DRAFT_7205317 [Phlegmacium glaucopus]
MCKTCCIRDVVAICFNKAHNSGRRPVSTSDDPFHLVWPVPSIPLRLPTSTDTSGFDFSALSFVSPSLPSLPTLSIPPGAVDPPALTPSSTGETETNPFYFGKPVPSALVADWNRRKQEREARQKSETSRMENERRIKHTVLLVAYLEDMAEPIPLPLQDINTWPTLNLAHLPHLVAQLGVQKLDELELYVRSNHGCFWIPNPDHSMSVKTDEKVFIRRKGVKTPSLPSTFVNAMAQYDSPSRSAPISSRKRTRESSASPPLMPRCLKFPRVDIDLTDDSDTQQGSPLPVPLSPSPSPLPSRPQLPQPTSCDLDQDLQVDRIWLSGCVHTPTDITGVVWPQRLYARDMVQGFALLQDATGNADLSVRFSHVFNGMSFKSSTYQLNRKFWSKLPAHLREEARVLPRTPSGLWTVWRKTQPGWN